MNWTSDPILNSRLDTVVMLAIAAGILWGFLRLIGVFREMRDAARRRANLPGAAGSKRDPGP